MKVLVIGAGGYVGSAVARKLVSSGHDVSALARNAETATSLASTGYHIVRGDLDNVASFDAALSATDAVIFTANIPFDREWPVAQALIAGLRKGASFILTTGTAVLSHETPAGEWCEATYAEDDPFAPPPWIAARVETERQVRAAANDGVRTMVVRPPLIWGLGGSKQIPAIFASVEKTGSACYIGYGLNLYSHVNVEDLADVYLRALELGKSGALYHAVAGEENWRAIAHAVAKVRGCDARSVSHQEACDIWGDRAGPLFFGVSSRSRAPRTRHELEWRPTHLDLLDDVANGSYRDAFGQ